MVDGGQVVVRIDPVLQLEPAHGRAVCVAQRAAHGVHVVGRNSDPLPQVVVDAPVDALEHAVAARIQRLVEVEQQHLHGGGNVGVRPVGPPGGSNGCMDEPSGTTLWYFAYGSNLDPGTFLGRRRMRPLETRIARLEGFELRFDLPVGPGERGVANVVPREGDHVWGAAYHLTHAEADRLDLTEGVPHGAYLRLDVELRPSDGAGIRAFTYHSARAQSGRKPSRRYLGLLLAGARHHGLPAPWVERLRAWPLAVDERDPQLPLF